MFAVIVVAFALALTLWLWHLGLRLGVLAADYEWTAGVKYKEPDAVTPHYYNGRFYYVIPREQIDNGVWVRLEEKKGMQNDNKNAEKST